MGGVLYAIAVIINIGVCFGIPFGGLIYLIKKKKSLKPFFIGAIVFFVSQILLRIPIINILAQSKGYNILANLYPIIFIFLISLSAGLFEECGRYLGFKYLLKNNRSFNDALIFGLGHGGIEAFLIVGIPILSSLNSIDANTLFMTSIERISAMTFHIAASVLVMYGINKGRKIYLFLAIIAHTLFNFVGVSLLSRGVNILIVEAILFIFAIIGVVFMVKIKKNFEGDILNEKNN